MKNFFLLAVVITILAVAHPAVAQGYGGCDESPENPTLILAGLATGAYTVSALRTRYRANRKTKQQ